MGQGKVAMIISRPWAWSNLIASDMLTPKIAQFREDFH
jgi:hypothetical protein